MTDKQTKAIQTMRKLYLGEYSRTYKKSDRIKFFEKISGMGTKAGAKAWEKFANATLAQLQKEMEAAISLFDEAIELDPKFAYPWNGKGFTLNKLKRYDEAIAAYEKAIALDPEYAYPWNGKGNVLHNQKRYDEAIAAYDKAIDLDPEFAYPWNGKGNSLRSQKRYDEAMDAYEKAIALDPEYSTPWNGKGNAFDDLKRHYEAMAAYEKAVALDPERAYQYYNLGLTYWEHERPDDAVKAFRRVFELESDPKKKEIAEYWIARASRMVESKKAKRPKKERVQEDRSSDEALITDLHEALKDDLPEIEKKKIDFDKQMEESVSRDRIIGKGGVDDILLVLRDWNSYSPILRRDLRDEDGPGPDERLGGGYFLAWKEHGIVIDPGMDFVTQLYKKKLSIADVDTVVVTHCHLDHIRDLESLVDLNYRDNGARGFKPHPRNNKFRQIQFRLCRTANKKYADYLMDTGSCLKPVTLQQGDESSSITDFIDILPVRAEHRDIDGYDDKAIGLVFVLKDEEHKPVKRIGFTSDSRWFEELPNSFKDCDVLVAHLGTIETGEPGKPDFLKKDLGNHLGTRGCFRLMHGAKPKLFVMGEFGEELVETRFKILQVFNKLSPDETSFVLGGDSNLAIGLGEKLSVYCSHPECAPLRTRIELDKVCPVLGGDFLFQYICGEHELGSRRAKGKK